jgi:hypothetical protein
MRLRLLIYFAILANAQPKSERASRRATKYSIVAKVAGFR